MSSDDPAASPEHLVLSSLGMCLLTTFETFATRDGIEVLSWDARVRGTVDLTPDGLMFTSIVLSLEIAVAGNVDHVDRALEEAKQYCLVLNSLRVPVVIEAEIHTPHQHEPLGLAG